MRIDQRRMKDATLTVAWAPFGARELGVVFAYAGFINIIVQGLLLTQAGRFASDRIIVLVATFREQIERSNVELINVRFAPHKPSFHSRPLFDSYSMVGIHLRSLASEFVI
jgi:hypothetical protein